MRKHISQNLFRSEGEGDIYLTGDKLNFDIQRPHFTLRDRVERWLIVDNLKHHSL